jgi:hypothetical protein
MSLIDQRYFQGPLHLAQLGKSEVIAALQVHIDQHENPFLRAALGYDLWNEFNTAFLASIAEEAPVDLPQKWKDLRDGIAFTNLSGIKKVFRGLANPTTKISCVASYVYWHKMRSDTIQTVGIGTVKTAGDNATNVDPTSKLVFAWDLMQQEVNLLWEFLEANKDTYTPYDTTQIDYAFFGCSAPGVYHSINAFGI